MSKYATDMEKVLKGQPTEPQVDTGDFKGGSQMPNGVNDGSPVEVPDNNPLNKIRK